MKVKRLEGVPKVYVCNTYLRGGGAQTCHL